MTTSIHPYKNMFSSMHNMSLTSNFLVEAPELRSNNPCCIVTSVPPCIEALIHSTVFNVQSLLLQIWPHRRMLDTKLYPFSFFKLWWGCLEINVRHVRLCFMPSCLLSLSVFLISHWFARTLQCPCMLCAVSPPHSHQFSITTVKASH